MDAEVGTRGTWPRPGPRRSTHRVVSSRRGFRGRREPVPLWIRATLCSGAVTASRGSCIRGWNGRSATISAPPPSGVIMNATSSTLVAYTTCPTTVSVVSHRLRNEAGPPYEAGHVGRSTARFCPATPSAPSAPDRSPPPTNEVFQVGRVPGSSYARGADFFGAEAWRGLAERLGLSGRELDIVRAIFDGNKEAAIARNLEMSPHTVHEHLRRLHRKLGVRDRVEVVLTVVCCGLQR